MDIRPILLCGGSGTRLWPLSRRSYPKQFAPLMGEGSLFQAAIRRATGPGFAPPVAVTVDPFRFIVMEQLAATETAPAAILLEPAPRNTAPSVLAAALWAAAEAPQSPLLILPSDHVVDDVPAFQATVRAALPATQAGEIVTFGITPTRAETGYGYLELAPNADLDAGTPHVLQRFTEKPEAEAAAAMLAAGHHLWNAGMFLATAETLIATYRAVAPVLFDQVTAAMAGVTADLGFTRLAPKPWEEIAADSIDYAVMEKARNLAVMPFAGRWSDLGGWDAVWAETGPDSDGNVCSAGATALDCENTLLRADSPGMELVGIGLDDIIAVAMSDAVLVGRKSRAQEVALAVAALKSREAAQAEQFPQAFRPWGWFETLVAGPRFQVKRIVVHPGAALSLQSHLHRAEHWVVVEGTAEVTVAGDTRLIAENESVYVPIGAKHRLRNPGKLPMMLIEVQTGAYLGEDDITRYDDLYARD